MVDPAAVVWRVPCYASRMSDQPPDDAGESPMQRALRMKKAAAEARPKPPRGGKFQREQSMGIAAGKSKPWMKQ